MFAPQQTTITSFAPQNIIPETPPETHFYSHGFTPEQVAEIKAAKEALEKRNQKEHPITLEEFKSIVVPWCRINRTEEFILNPGKEKKEKKVKEPKEPGEVKEKRARGRPPKEKKISAKEKAKKIEDLIFKRARGEELTDDEEEFFNAQMNF